MPGHGASWQCVRPPAPERCFLHAREDAGMDQQTLSKAVSRHAAAVVFGHCLVSGHLALFQASREFIKLVQAGHVTRASAKASPCNPCAAAQTHRSTLPIRSLRCCMCGSSQQKWRSRCSRRSQRQGQAYWSVYHRQAAPCYLHQSTWQSRPAEHRMCG